MAVAAGRTWITPCSAVGSPTEIALLSAPVIRDRDNDPHPGSRSAPRGTTVLSGTRLIQDILYSLLSVAEHLVPGFFAVEVLSAIFLIRKVSGIAQGTNSLERHTGDIDVRVPPRDWQIGQDTSISRSERSS